MQKFTRLPVLIAVGVLAAVATANAQSSLDARNRARINGDILNANHENAVLRRDIHNRTGSVRADERQISRDEAIRRRDEHNASREAAIERRNALNARRRKINR